MPSAKKPTLRTLAVEAGLFKQNDMKVFQMGVDELVDVLKKDFPGIEEMDDAAVNDLIADVKKNGVKGGTGGGKDEEPARGRGRGAAKDEEPARGRGGRGTKDEEPARGRGRGREEPETKKEPEEPARGRGRGRGAEKEEPEEPETRGRGRGRGREEPADEKPADEPARGRGRGGRGRAEEPEEKPAETKGGGSDNTQVVALLEEVLGQFGALNKRLDGLEKQAAGNTEAIEALQGKVDELYDGVECVVFGDSAEKGEKTLADVIKRVKG